MGTSIYLYDRLIKTRADIFLSEVQERVTELGEGMALLAVLIGDHRSMLLHVVYLMKEQMEKCVESLGYGNKYRKGGSTCWEGDPVRYLHRFPAFENKWWTLPPKHPLNF